MSPVWKKLPLVVIAIPAALLLWLLADGMHPYLGAQPPAIVDILRGTPTRQIAGQLETAKVIRSRWTFLALHLFAPGNSLKAGEYSFDRPATPWQVLEKIIRGDVSYQMLTIPEGLSRFEIADLVAAGGFATRDEFLAATEDASLLADLDPGAQTVEGYLFPDSYKLPRHARPAEIVREMVNRFRQVLTGLGPLPPERSLREVVTVASLVEKETGVPEERSVIAGIFYNRLKRGMALQADPSVVYAALLANHSVDHIHKSDLRFASPYNTYVRHGLPPGPITNPGRASLKAAASPATSDYLFFVARVEGGHVFSRTLAEHNRAVAQYRQELRDELDSSAAPSGQATSAARR